MCRTFVAVMMTALVLLSHVTAKAAEVTTSAVSAILMDAASGRVLYEKNAHELRLIASITKLMTALVAVEAQPDLDAVVTVDGAWLAGAEGSSIYLRAGDRLTFRELLYGMLLASGNDAAQVVACYCAGDLESFAQRMNEKAAQLGMKNSHFVNPSGLNADGHYSTAYDMALCARACMKNEVIAEMVATHSVSFETRTFTNHNKLLNMYDGCIGLKTGYTERAGRTLVSCVEREGWQLIAVTLSAPDDWNDHMNLYDYGFQNFYKQELCIEGQLVRTLPVQGSLKRFVGVAPVDTATYALTNGEQVEVVFSLPEQVQAPVYAGEQAGYAEFFVNGVKIAQVELAYDRSAEYHLFAQRSLQDRFLEFLQGEAAVLHPLNFI